MYIKPRCIRIRIHVEKMDLTLFLGSFMSLKLTEIAILDVLMRFWHILVAKKLAPNLGPLHALTNDF